MKCPTCKANLNWEDRYDNKEGKGCYHCAQCGTNTCHKHGMPFLIGFLLIGAPVIEIFVRLLVEAPLDGMLVGDIPVSRVISMLVSACTVFVIFLKLYGIEAIRNEASGL